MEALILVANPGSASRKYALYADNKCLARVHFELEGNKIVYTVESHNGVSKNDANISHITFSSSLLPEIFSKIGVLGVDQKISKIGLRIVAPSSYFQKDRQLNEVTVKKLGDLKHKAPLHIHASLQELNLLTTNFPDSKIVGVSDSAFHSTMPEKARLYGLPKKDSEKFDVLRFGYHGLSVESAVNILKKTDKLSKRTIICHVGSGVSITALKYGKSIDTSMGFSPLEGVVMSTRSGSVDITALQKIASDLKLNKAQLQEYLNNKSGLLGLSELSGDVRELLTAEKEGNEKAKTALDVYVYKIQQTIGALSASLGGIDALVFTGTVGERNSEIRRRIINKMAYLGLMLDAKANHIHGEFDGLKHISSKNCPVKIYVVPADEYSIIAKHTQDFIYS